MITLRKPNWIGITLCLLVLLLQGCADTAGVRPADTAFILPWQGYVVQTKPDSTPLEYVVVVQREAESSRWLVFDPLGVPLARQTLRDGAWKSDGLSPPNREALALFDGLMFAWAPDSALDRTYGAGNWRQVALPDGRLWRLLLHRSAAPWIVEWPNPSQGQDLTLVQGNVVWTISPLPEERP